VKYHAGAQGSFLSELASKNQPDRLPVKEGMTMALVRNPETFFVCFVF
jgi:hypothetical protein